GFTRNGSPPYTALTNAASRHGLRASSGLLVVIVEAAGRQTRGCWSSYPHRGAVRIRPIGASTPLWTESTTIPRRRRASRAACGVRRAPRGVRGAACTTRHAARGTRHAPRDMRHAARANRRSTAFRANPLHFVHPDRVLGHRLSHDAFRNAVDPGASGRISEMHATPPPEAVAGWP